MSGGSDRLRRLLSDRRARVPFALIALLLVLSSATFLVHLETREDASESLDADLAIERTDAALETAARDSLTRASERAAAQPLTVTAESEFGEILEMSRGNDGPPTADRRFKRFLEALVYLEAKAQFETAGQSVGDVDTTVELPDITDPDSFEAAIDRVTVRFGSDAERVEAGIVEAKIENITTVASVDGTEIARKSESVEVAVATPVKQLHDRVERFQDRLDAGISESGFTQRFNARTYALGWARGYAQYSGQPVTEVIANRHVVPSANDAIYRTQKDVFGAADPQLQNAIRRGWLCMAMHDAEGLYGEYSDIDGEYAEDLCAASDWLFGSQATGDPPAAPSTMDILANAPGLDAEETIGVNETAYLPLRDLVAADGNHTIDSAIDRIFEVEVGMDQTFNSLDRPNFDHDPPEPFASGGTTEHDETNHERTSVRITELEQPAADGEFYEIRGEVDIYLEDRRSYEYEIEDRTKRTQTVDWDSLSGAFELRLYEEELSPDARIDEYEADTHETTVEAANTYEFGPERGVARSSETVPEGVSPDGFSNFAGAADQILAATVAESQYGEHPVTSSSEIDETDVKHWLEREWDGITDAGELAVAGPDRVQLERPSQIDGSLEETILDSLTQLQEETSEISIQFERREMLHDGSGTGPFSNLQQAVQSQKDELLDRDEPFTNVGQKAVYEVKYSYFTLLEEELERFDSAHASAMSGLNAELDDTGLGRALDFLQQGVDSSDYESVPLESSSLTDDVRYEVAGSPTYLVTENITSEQVPPVDDDIEEFAPMAAKNENSFKLPYDSVVDGILSRLGNWLGLSDPDAELTLRMSGEALQAGQLAEDAIEAGSSEYGDADHLVRLTDAFETNVEAGVEDFADSAAKEIGYQLYPGDVVLPCTDSGTYCPRSFISEIRLTLEDDVTCTENSCRYHVSVPTVCRELACSVEEDSQLDTLLEDIEGTISDTVDRYGDGTAETAIAISDGDFADQLVPELSKTLAAEAARPEYARDAGEEKWDSIVRSAIQPAITSAVTSTTVTMSDTELVEELDTEVRQALESVSEDIVEERFEEHFGGERFELEEYQDWVDGVETPVRVPAGVPLLPVPNLWYATANVWDIEVEGTYARFEATATMGTPDGPGTMSYVRENRTVSIDIAGESRVLGDVEPIEFSGRSILVVVVPPGKVGVGDRDDEDPECSPTWPVTGDVDDGEFYCDSPSQDASDTENDDLVDSHSGSIEAGRTGE